MRFSRKWLIVSLALVASVALASAASYEWFLRISTPVRYGDSMQFWYTDETLNGEWIDVGINQTTVRPAVDLTKGVFDVKVRVNNTRLRPSGLRVEIKAVDTAISSVTDFIGFNITGVGFSWGELSWEQILPAETVTQWNVRYVLSEEAPVGYTGFYIEWTVNRFETVVQNELGFTTISVGTHSGYGSQANLVIQDSQAWIDLWNQHMLFMVEPLPVPEVDFSTNMVVAVFMGVKPTGGYALHICEVVETESTIVVMVERTEPGPTCIVPQVLTQPYHMIQIARTEKSVIFDVTTRILECP